MVRIKRWNGRRCTIDHYMGVSWWRLNPDDENNFTTDWQQKWTFNASHFLNLLSLSWLNAPGRDNRKCSWSVPQSSSHVLKKFWKLRTSAEWKRALFFIEKITLNDPHTRYCSERVTIGMWFASRLFRFFYIYLIAFNDTPTLRNAGKIGQVTTGHVKARFLVTQITFLKCHWSRIEDAKLAGHSRIWNTNCKLTFARHRFNQIDLYSNLFCNINFVFLLRLRHIRTPRFNDLYRQVQIHSKCVKLC